MPKMVNASILLDIHCCLPVDQELMVDMNIQPNKKKHFFRTHTYLVVLVNRVRTDSSSDTDRGPIWVNLD